MKWPKLEQRKTETKLCQAKTENIEKEMKVQNGSHWIDKATLIKKKKIAVSVTEAEHTVDDIPLMH